jgi:hypothetical protein
MYIRSGEQGRAAERSHVGCRDRWLVYVLIVDDDRAAPHRQTIRASRGWCRMSHCELHGSFRCLPTPFLSRAVGSASRLHALAHYFGFWSAHPGGRFWVKSRGNLSLPLLGSFLGQSNTLIICLAPLPGCKEGHGYGRSGVGTTVK